MPTKIFIGNVNPNTQPEQLRELFEQYGKVTECDVIKNYAFVHMGYETEANNAIRNLDGFSVCGSRIRVELSHGKKSDTSQDKKTDRKFPFKGRPPMSSGPPPPFEGRFPPPRTPYNWYDQRTFGYPDFFDRETRMPPHMDRYPPHPDRMPTHPDRMPPPDRFRPPPPPLPPHGVERMIPPERFGPPLPERMRPPSPYDRRPPPPPPPAMHAHRDPYYMERDPYYRERSPLARAPPEYYDRRTQGRDYATQFQGNGEPMGNYRRDQTMGREMPGMKPMGMDQGVRVDPMGRDPMGRDPMARDPMARDPMGRQPMGQGDMMEHPSMRPMQSMMRERPTMGMNGPGQNYATTYSNQQQPGGYSMNSSYTGYGDRSRVTTDTFPRNNYQAGATTQDQIGIKKPVLPDQSFLQTGPIYF